VRNSATGEVAQPSLPTTAPKPWFSFAGSFLSFAAGGHVHWQGHLASGNRMRGYRSQQRVTAIGLPRPFQSVAPRRTAGRLDRSNAIRGRSPPPPRLEVLHASVNLENRSTAAVWLMRTLLRRITIDRVMNRRARMAAAWCGGAAVVALALGCGVDRAGASLSSANNPSSTVLGAPSPTTSGGATGGSGGGALPVQPVGGGACIIGLNCGCIRGITCPGTIPHHHPAPTNDHQPAPGAPSP
jgi:hypothetical protein